jgi:hypothetical protein
MTITTVDINTTDDHRPELLALIAAATRQLTGTWASLIAAQHELLDRLERLGPFPTGRRIREALSVWNGRLGAFDRDIRALIERWAAEDLPTAYRDGALRALAQAGQDTHQFTWTTDHQAALTALTATFWADLIRRVTETVRRAQAFGRAAQDQARTVPRTTSSTAPGVIDTGAPRTVSSTVPRPLDTGALLEAHPLDTVIYANSARHPVASWAKAAFAAQAATTANHGAINTAVLELGAEWMECTDGTECGFVSHEDPDHASGTLRTTDEASAYPIAHPGCIRQWTPRPDLTGRPDITSGDPA